MVPEAHTQRAHDAPEHHAEGGKPVTTDHTARTARGSHPGQTDLRRSQGAGEGPLGAGTSAR